MSNYNPEKENRYYVGSSGGEPKRIFFDKEKAFETLEYEYVDEFDQDGYLVKSYMRSGAAYMVDI